MDFKHVTLTTLVSMAVILVAVFLSGFLSAWYMDPWYLLFLLPVPPAISYIIHVFNQSNRQIAFFFEAIRNEDSSLKFPSRIKHKSLRHLYQSLNNLNGQINEIRLHNEYLEKYYRTFIQHAATGLVAVNQDHEVEFMNDKAFEYTGIPLFTPLHLVPVKNPDLLNTLTMIGHGEVFTYKHFKGDTPVNLLIRMKEIRYGGKVSRIYSLQDITHELDEKELDSWQKLIRVLTHEIMNSIAPIVSLTGTLRRFFSEDGRPADPAAIDRETIANVIQGLDTIEERGNGLVNFVDNYRKLTRIPKPEIASFAAEEWMEQVKMLFHDSLSRQEIRFEVKTDNRMKDLTGDKKLLTQVMINILNNAVEALSVSSRDQKNITLSLELSKQNRPVISISNNGPVIPDEVMEKIFIPFFTTKEQGSGIGLSLSRQILRLHRGYIHAESTEEMTSFIITL